MGKKKNKEKLIEEFIIGAYSPNTEPSSKKPPRFKPRYASRNSALNKAKKNE
jgi:hypothetical protein